MWPRPRSGYHFLMAIVMGERQVCDLSWGPVKASEMCQNAWGKRWSLSVGADHGHPTPPRGVSAGK